MAVTPWACQNLVVRAPGLREGVLRCSVPAHRRNRYEITRLEVAEGSHDKVCPPLPSPQPRNTTTVSCVCCRPTRGNREPRPPQFAPAALLQPVEVTTSPWALMPAGAWCKGLGFSTAGEVQVGAVHGAAAGGCNAGGRLPSAGGPPRGSAAAADLGRLPGQYSCSAVVAGPV